MYLVLKFNKFNNFSSIFKINSKILLLRNFCKSLTVFAFIFLFLAKPALALRLIEENYIASIKASQSNIRSGPGVTYPIKFSYNVRYVPVHVVSKYDNWNEIIDYEGDRGWINQNLLSSKQTVIIKTPKTLVNLYSAATTKSRILLKLENKVIAKLIGCKKSWCKIEIADKEGWIEQRDIWPQQI